MHVILRENNRILNKMIKPPHKLCMLQEMLERILLPKISDK